MEKDPVADECSEIFQQHVDNLPFDEAVEAVRGLKKYIEEAQKDLFQVEGRGRYVIDTSDTDVMPS